MRGFTPVRMLNKLRRTLTRGQKAKGESKTVKKQKNTILTVLASAASFFLVIAMLFSALSLVMNSEKRHRSEYERLNVADFMGMSDEDIVRSLMRLVDYMEGRVDDIVVEVTVYGESTAMFNERETMHMVDVRTLYQAWRTASCIMYAFAAVVLAALIAVFGKRWYVPASKGFIIGFAAFAAMLLAIGAYAVIDFNSFWTSFHLLFFSNDLWLLDPAESRMINMFPIEFFSNIILNFVLIFVPVSVMMLVLSIIARVRVKKEKVQ